MMALYMLVLLLPSMNAFNELLKPTKTTRYMQNALSLLVVVVVYGCASAILQVDYIVH